MALSRRTTFAETDSDRYANGDAYCHADADVSEKGAQAYACSSSDCDAYAEVAIGVHARQSPSVVATSCLC